MYFCLPPLEFEFAQPGSTMAEISDSPSTSKPVEENTQTHAPQIDSKTTRNTKPGVKRLIISVSVLISFILGPFLPLSLSLTYLQIFIIYLFINFLLSLLQVFLFCGNPSKSTGRPSLSIESTPSRPKSNRLPCPSHAAFKPFSSVSISRLRAGRWERRSRGKCRT